MSIQNLAVGGILPFIIWGSTLVAMTWVIAAIDWQLALMAVGTPILYIMTGVCRRLLRRMVGGQEAGKLRNIRS
jgi:hypothetical protein